VSVYTRNRDEGLGVWFREEILNALSAVDDANWDVAQHIDAPEMRLYRKGFEAAIKAVATAFGLAYAPLSSHSGELTTRHTTLEL